MSDRRNDNHHNTNNTGDGIPWVIIVILMFVFPPLGWILLATKLGFFSSLSSSYKRRQNMHSVSMANHVSTDNANINTNTHTSINENRLGIPSAIRGTFTSNTEDKQNKKRKKRLFRKTGKGVSTMLLLLAIILFLISIPVIGSSVERISSYGVVYLTSLVLGISFFMGAIISFFSRNVVRKSLGRYKSYYSYMEGKEVVPLHELAQVAGVHQKVVVRDLRAMIGKDFLPIGAYIDYELECLVLSAQAANKLRMEIKDADTTVIQTEDVSKFQDNATLAEIREVHMFIKDQAISEKVKRLEELAVKIFHIVEENPEKQQQIRRFTSYYLPTTLKLVRSYVTLEKQGEKGENIMSAKRSISDILDTLSTGFEQQLDQLFTADVLDIAADINVLENLMKQDGLKSDGQTLQASE